MRRSRTARFAVLALLLAAGSPACRGPAQPVNLVFVLVDTLRADHLTSYGDPRQLTPNIAAFASQSIVFENASSQASCTFPSMNSLLTSRHPGVFLVQSDRDFAIPPEIPSLAVLLEQAGYATYGPIVRRTPSRFNDSGGFDAGFDVFDERCEWRDASCVNAVAQQLLEEATPPFALYLHYLDPHALYAPPQRFERRFGVGYQGEKQFVARGDPRPIEKMIYDDGPDVDLEDADVAHLKNLYADEVAYFDAAFGWLVSKLESTGQLERAIVLLASDHGEGFLEHGDVHHCHALYETSVHTPLLIRLPGGKPAGRRSAVVRNLDVLPTLLDYMGVDAGAQGFAGRSLRSVIDGDDESPVRAFASQGLLRGVRDGPYKLIHDLETGTDRLYDLAEDPDERENLAEDRSQVADRLRAALDEWMAIHDPRPEPGSETNFGAGLEERLRELGYIE
jgi:arylsulfatase A-like enzyme